MKQPLFKIVDQSGGDLRELRERLNEKAALLDGMAAAASTWHGPSTQARLAGKADGVRLAVSFIDELLREPSPWQASLDATAEAARRGEAPERPFVDEVEPSPPEANDG